MYIYTLPVLLQMIIVNVRPPYSTIIIAHTSTLRTMLCTHAHNTSLITSDIAQIRPPFSTINASTDPNNRGIIFTMVGDIATKVS